MLAQYIAIYFDTERNFGIYIVYTYTHTHTAMRDLTALADQNIACRESKPFMFQHTTISPFALITCAI